jgi:hypothetical protein
VRGTSVALFDYAYFNETVLGNESYIVFNGKSSANQNIAVQKFVNRFPNRVYAYDDFEDINNICEKEKIDFSYFIKSGEKDEKLSSCRNGIHAVFQVYEPHGDVYAYISEWLANEAYKKTNCTVSFVPHIVYLPKPTENLRDIWGIPKNAFVFGRYGGEDQFNIDFVKEAVVEFVKKNNSVWFVFFNTIPFVDHPRVKFFDSFSDMQLKSNIVDSCDAMIHGREMGESFGLAICEFLYGNKPVLAWSGGNDLHHVDILKNTDLLYADKTDLMNKMETLVCRRVDLIEYKKLVEIFSPSIVMEKFNQVFLKG